MEIVEAVTELVHGSGSVVLDQDVGMLEQSFEQGAVFDRLEIERNALFAAIERDEVRALFFDEGADVPGVVADAGAFNFDDPRAEIAKHHGAVRASEYPGEVHNRNPRQGAQARHAQRLQAIVGNVVSGMDICFESSPVA